jgi:hypothetical protein
VTFTAVPPQQQSWGMGGTAHPQQQKPSAVSYAAVAAKQKMFPLRPSFAAVTRTMKGAAASAPRNPPVTADMPLPATHAREFIKWRASLPIEFPYLAGIPLSTVHAPVHHDHIVTRTSSASDLAARTSAVNRIDASSHKFPCFLRFAGVSSWGYQVIGAAKPNSNYITVVFQLLDTRNREMLEYSVHTHLAMDVATNAVKLVIAGSGWQNGLRGSSFPVYQTSWIRKMTYYLFSNIFLQRPSIYWAIHTALAAQRKTCVRMTTDILLTPVC